MTGKMLPDRERRIPGAKVVLPMQLHRRRIPLPLGWALNFAKFDYLMKWLSEFDHGHWREKQQLSAVRKISRERGMSDDRRRGDDAGGVGTGVITKTKPKTKKPSLYKVLLLNDDYTPMEFVVHVLERFFNKGRDEATVIMLHVHQHGVGVCGHYTYEVAETKVTQVMDFAKQHQHPLQCTMERE